MSESRKIKSPTNDYPSKRVIFSLEVPVAVPMKRHPRPGRSSYSFQCLVEMKMLSGCTYARMRLKSSEMRNWSVCTPNGELGQKRELRAYKGNNPNIHICHKIMLQRMAIVSVDGFVTEWIKKKSNGNHSPWNMIWSVKVRSSKMMHQTTGS